jgi:hypothetical protein
MFFSDNQVVMQSIDGFFYYLSIEYNTAVQGKKLQYCLLAVWFTLSVGILSWGVWPRSLESRHLAVPGYGRLTLEWDSHNPIGDISIIKLSFDLEERNDHSGVSQPSIKARFSNSSQYVVVNQVEVNEEAAKLAEARLELAGVDLKPLGIVGQPFRPGGEVVFYWNVNSLVEGDFQGSAWLYVVDKSAPKNLRSRDPVAIQPIDLHWRDLFGLSGTAARYVGIFGLLAGFLFFIVIRLQGRQASQ